MIKRIDDCVSCDLPCVGDRCVFRGEADICDICGECVAQYKADGLSYCEDCLDIEARRLFDEMWLEEQAALLFHNVRRIGE